MSPVLISCYRTQLVTHLSFCLLLPDSALATSSHQALTCYTPPVVLLPQLGEPGGRDLVSACSKSIPTIRGPGEQAGWDLDSAPWGIPVCRTLEATAGRDIT
ncbi:unnamed protein product, partial [Staurois parvus]